MNVLKEILSKRGPKPSIPRSVLPMRSLFTAFAATLLLASAVTTHAQTDDGLLPVEQAFQVKASVAEAGHIALHIDIAKDYYLYRGRIKAKTTQAGLTLGTLDLPPGIAKHDEFQGDVEIYHGRVEATLPYTLASATPGAVVTLTVQGCHEVDPKICYPPHPTALTLDLPASGGAPASALPAMTAGTPLLQLGAAQRGAPANGTPLPAEQAFVFEAIALSPTRLLARWSMPPGYYLYQDKSTLTLAGSSDDRLGAPQWPAAVDHQDEHFGTVKVYFNEVELPIDIARASGAPQKITLHAEYQGCQDNGICYPVMQKDITLDLPAASAAELAAAKAQSVAAPATASAAPASAAPAIAPPAGDAPSLPLVLLFALLGGVILNLMPCVLPVLSLKALGLAQSGESVQSARRHALLYTAGVLVTFAAVGLGVLVLRTAGHALGWGFQLQQPLFVAILVYVLFAIGLSLSGVFHFGAGLANLGSGLANRSGPAGDFFTGVLAVIVASPCTTPFMGSALAYAFAASAWVGLLVFLALGLGLALPFLLIGFVPALARCLPRPGAWMETFKQFLAFPMYLTAAWLAWVLGNQRGIDAVGYVLVGAIVLALGLWAWERGRLGAGWSRALAVLAILAALLPLSRIAQLAPASAAATPVSDAVPYSAQRLAELRAQGRSVFVDMGADWCVTCKVNERAVLHTDAFRDLLKRSNAVLMTGDWTNADPAISAFLKEYHAVGVPLYVVFRAGESGPGQVLPAVLTHGIVTDALMPKP